jgi:DoxX
MSSLETPLRPAAAANGSAAAAASHDVGAAAYQSFWLLRIGFTVAPILFGVDKFFNWTVHWPDYLAGWINSIIPGSGQDFMYVVGGIEIAAGLLVAVAPRIGAFVVAGWLAGIVVNLLTKNPPQYYDIALRDFGLFLGALTLGRLAWAVQPRRRRV